MLICALRSFKYMCTYSWAVMYVLVPVRCAEWEYKFRSSRIHRKDWRYLEEARIGVGGGGGGGRIVEFMGDFEKN